MSDEAQRAVDANPKSAADWHRRGIALADDGKLDQAITAFRRALRIDESLAEIHNDLGTALFEKHWYAEAEGSFRRAVALKPDHGVAYANLGAALRAQGRLQEGRREYQRALLMKVRGLLPRFLQWRVGDVREEIANISRALTERGLAQAKLVALDAEKRFPGNADIAFLAAGIIGDLGDTRDALVRMRAAIGLDSGRAQFHIALVKLCARVGDEPGALAAAQTAVKLEPGSAEAHAALSTAQRASRPELAARSARRAIELDPQGAAGHDNLALALRATAQLDLAEKHAREAVRLSPTTAGYRMNLALILKDAGRLEEALSLYHRAAREASNHFEVYLNLGTLAMECAADLEAARGWYARARALGEDPRVTLSESVADLLEGRYEAAWPRYEARKQVAEHVRSHIPYAALPAWNGEALNGKTLLVYGEQGLGDEIMFASLYPELAQRGPRIALACDARLQALFKRSFPTLEIGASNPDFAVAAGSLGLHFRKKAADFPLHQGYLTPDAQKTAAWRERLAKLGPRRKIGISWIGGTWATGRARRSLTLEQLRPLLEAPATDWISLQYGDCAAEIAEFSRESGIALHAFPGVTDDMDELAALIQALDTVVSVCNTTVHVAGAIGKEVLVMAPFIPEWRYGLRGEKMAWYPAARVFRQTAFGAWEGVISEVKAKLSGA